MWRQAVINWQMNASPSDDWDCGSDSFWFFCSAAEFQFFFTHFLSVLEKLFEKISFGLVLNDQYIRTRMWKFHLKGLVLEFFYKETGNMNSWKPRGSCQCLVSGQHAYTYLLLVYSFMLSQISRWDVHNIRGSVIRWPSRASSILIPVVTDQCHGDHGRNYWNQQRISAVNFTDASLLSN